MSMTQEESRIHHEKPYVFAVGYGPRYGPDKMLVDLVCNRFKLSLQKKELFPCIIP